MELEVGGIYRVDSRKRYHGFGPIELWDTVLRVIAYDKFEVFVDIELHKGEGDWDHNKLRKGQAYFGRKWRKYFDEDATQIGFSEVTTEIKQFYRTDILFRIGRVDVLDWKDPPFENEHNFKKFIEDITSLEWQAQILDSKVIYLNPGAGSGPLVLFPADNQKYFSAAEILWKANTIQKKKLSEFGGGVGIYRSGTKAGVPVYYIGEYYDRAGCMKMYESIGIQTNP